jgi:hypothetical protein
VLAAPFMKYAIVQRLLEGVHESVKGTLYTRWRPDEVAAGVSDLSVFDLVQNRLGWTLYLCQELHAKYYRIDDTYLVGSANLTATALQWRTPSNIELLIEEDGGAPEWFEDHLNSNAVRATDSIRHVIQSAADKIISIPKPFETIPDSIQANSFSDWLPVTRDPSSIHVALKEGFEMLVGIVAQGVKYDLNCLQVTLVQQEEAFVMIRCQLAQHPLIIELTEFCMTPQRFGAVRDYLADWIVRRGGDRNASEAWQTLMRWLLFYFPEKYKVERPRHSEIFQALK